MRSALAPLALLLLIGCRPLDAGVAVEDGNTPPLAALSDDGPAIPSPDHRGMVRLIDGDTFELDGETVRISNIDTPEMPPRSKCLAEQRLALAAKDALGDVMETGWNALPVLEREGRDRYGRTLARVSVNGRDVGDEMVRRGFAEPWLGRRAVWCGQEAPNEAR